MEKNQNAIEAGRYEIENRRFYHPDEYTHQQQPPHHRQQHQQEQHAAGEEPTPPLYQVPFDNDMGTRWSVTGGADANERGRQSSRSKLGNLFSKATGKPSSRVGSDGEIDPTPVPERARLKKRSSSRLSGSKLSVVGE